MAIRIFIISDAAFGYSYYKFCKKKMNFLFKIFLLFLLSFLSVLLWAVVFYFVSFWELYLSQQLYLLINFLQAKISKIIFFEELVRVIERCRFPDLSVWSWYLYIMLHISRWEAWKWSAVKKLVLISVSLNSSSTTKTFFYE